MDVGVLVSRCGCSLLPSPHFHFEVRMELGTGLKTSVGVGIDVCTCAWVLCLCTRQKTTPSFSGLRYDLLHWKFSANLFKLAIQNEY